VLEDIHRSTVSDGCWWHSQLLLGSLGLKLLYCLRRDAKTTHNQLADKTWCDSTAHHYCSSWLHFFFALCQKINCDSNGWRFVKTNLHANIQN
jgi:hypothetical protein